MQMKTMSELKLVPTEDGSLSLLDSETCELYHNLAGAYTEALQNYFEPSGARFILQQQGRLNLLDACYGLGYNALVLVNELVRIGVQGELRVCAVDVDPEVFPLAERILEDPRLEYVRKLLGPDQIPSHPGIFAAEVNGLRLHMEVVCTDLRKFLVHHTAERQEYDLIFHDPFSPRKVPDLWTVEIFHRYFALTKNRRGRVLTYSIAPAIQGGLMEAGFSLFRTTPVGLKKGGTLAAIDPEALNKLVREHAIHVEPEIDNRSTAKSLVPFRDPDQTGDRDSILSRRSAEQDAIVPPPAPRERRWIVPQANISE